ncbi:MAG: hypothetical protein KGJ78_13970 [Alphaproteobacteria bacterium]|nr:hypothetical protein [Alphaproteobacteria bacterium]
MSRGWRSIHVRNRITDLIRRPGGISRSQAVKAATTDVQRLREDLIQHVPDEIGALEAIADGASGDYLSAGDLETMLEGAERLLILSGTFGLTLLDEVVKKFCDLAAGVIERGQCSVAPVSVHLRAMRLVSPDSPPLSNEEQDNLLRELSKVHAHLGLAEHHLAEEGDQISQQA